MSTDTQVACDVCGKGNARMRYITRAYGKGDDLLLIENVPVISCPDCGESYLTAETLHQIDQIKRERKRFAVERPVEVARLG
jgi:YgiT-type zinc finger domain-containing protein